MFRAFYGFTRDPFSITPDPNFLYLSDTHREALAHLIYGIDTKKGFIVVTGEIGVGKTTIVNALLQRLDGTKAITAFIFNTNLTPPDFYQLISDELGLHKPASKAEFLLTLNNFLVMCHAKGDGPVVLIFDEAHNLNDELLEEIRLLLNLETHQEKLLQIVLSAQPELWKRLKEPSMRALRQRIVLQYRLNPLGEKDTDGYVRMRIKEAGGHTNIFTDKALKKIHRYSGGIPRLINLLCTHALIAAYVTGQESISAKAIKGVAKDLELDGAGLFRSKPTKYRKDRF